MVGESDQDVVWPRATIELLISAQVPLIISGVASIWYEAPAWLFQVSVIWFVPSLTLRAIGPVGDLTVTVENAPWLGSK